MGLTNSVIKEKGWQHVPCVDYLRLNAMTHNDVYPMPRTQDCLDVMAGLKMFSTMDILSTYNQVPMAERERHSQDGVQYKVWFHDSTSHLPAVDGAGIVWPAMATLSNICG